MHSQTIPCIAMQVHDESAARVRVAFETGANEGYQFKTHPNIDKQLYARNILGLKDAERPFVSGDILKWRMQARAAAAPPRKPNLSSLMSWVPCICCQSAQCSRLPNKLQLQACNQALFLQSPRWNTRGKHGHHALSPTLACFQQRARAPGGCLAGSPVDQARLHAWWLSAKRCLDAGMDLARRPRRRTRCR
jgi:hypothetical protein